MFHYVELQLARRMKTLVIDQYIGRPILSLAFFMCISNGRSGLLCSPIRHYLQTGIHRQLCVAGDAARNSRAENQSSVAAFHRALLPHLFLIFVKYCLLVLVVPHLF